MKNFLKRLLGDIFLREILFSVGNKLITIFITWLLSKLSDRFGNKIWYAELSSYLLEIQLQDFFNERKEELNKITMSNSETNV